MATLPDRDFDIDVDYEGPREFSSAFKEAAERWEEIIVADLPDVRKVDDLFIEACVIPIDGRGSVLGQAAPTYVRSASGLSLQGTMEFDIADMKAMSAKGMLTAIITHEMGHVLGLGTLWDRFDFIDRQNGGYTGENALAQYRALSGNTDAFLYHWRQAGDEALHTATGRKTYSMTRS